MPHAWLYEVRCKVDLKICAMAVDWSCSHALGGRRVESALRTDYNSTYNCLLSILHDARFVQDIAALYPRLPVFANLRCGLWYVPDATNTCYFKSTDGHCGSWSFSSTRLNLHVAEACASSGGCIIVDATRRGKTFPVRASKLNVSRSCCSSHALLRQRLAHNACVAA